MLNMITYTQNYMNSLIKNTRQITLVMLIPYAIGNTSVTSSNISQSDCESDFIVQSESELKSCLKNEVTLYV